MHKLNSESPVRGGLGFRIKGLTGLSNPGSTTEHVGDAEVIGLWAWGVGLEF